MGRGELYLLLWIALNISIIASVCPGEWRDIDGSCYKLFLQNSTFMSTFEAQELCASHNSSLASVTSQILEHWIYNQTKQLYQDEALRPSAIYIGFNDILHEGNFTWLNGAPVNFKNWIEGQDNSEFSAEEKDCAALTSRDNKWATDNSTGWMRIPCCINSLNVRAALCQKGYSKNGSDLLRQDCFADCPTGWRKWNAHCYRILDFEKAFDNAYSARRECLLYHADLPAKLNPSKETFIHFFFSKLGKISKEAGLYLGINDIGNEGNFRDLNGSLLASSAHTNWAPGEPHSNATALGNQNDSCVVLRPLKGNWDSSIRWYDIDCCRSQNISSVICEKPVNISIVVSPKNDIFAQECPEALQCSLKPCSKNSTCIDGYKNYTCDCDHGFTGRHCETEINFCLSAPCKNGAFCNPWTGGYTCNCTYGYNGTNCETVYDHCVSDPCQNNATCRTESNTFNCTCVVGTTGRNCETDIDDCVNVTCQNGGTCLDQLDSYRCNCPFGFSGTRCQTEIQCGELPSVANTTRTNITGSNAGDSAIYRCFGGHKFSDMTRAKRVKCTQAGGWQTIPGACQIHCDALPILANTVMNTNYTAVGTEVNYTCLEGHKFDDNSTSLNMTCQESGNWSAPLTNVTGCEVIRCPELPTYPHTELDSYNNTYNTTIIFWCDIGYELHDGTTARTIKCLRSGKWTARLPACQPIECPYITAINNGTRNTTNRTYDTYVEYKCDKDKRMLDGAVYRILKCDATKEWSDNVTHCASNRCPPIPFVANSTPSDTEASLYHSVTFTCIAGHRFFKPQEVKSKASTCVKVSNLNSALRWRPILQPCGPIECPPLTKPVNTTRNTETRLYNTVVTYSCYKGHRYPDSSSDLVIICQSDKRWNDTNLISCAPVECPPLYNVTNGTMIPPPNNLYLSVAKYQCNVKFKFLDGTTEKNVICNEEGKWSEDGLDCKKDRCDKLQMPDTVVPNTRNTSWYTVVTIRCAIGHEWPPERFGNKTSHVIECLAGGVWNDTNVPRCEPKICPKLTAMSHSTRNTTQDIHVYNTFIVYECDRGYEYDNITNEYRTETWCTDQAQWSREIPQCYVKNCTDVDPVANTTVIGNSTAFNSTIIFRCLPGFQYDDKTLEKTAICLDNETWTEFPEPCQTVHCPPLPHWMDMQFNDSSTDFLAVASYECLENYKYKDKTTGKKYTTCQEDKTWQPPVVECIPAKAVDSAIKGKSWDSPQAVPIGTIALAILGVVYGTIILVDLAKVWQDLMFMKSNIVYGIRAHRARVANSNRTA